MVAKARVGLAVARNTVRLAVVRDGRLVLAEATPATDPVEVEQAIEKLLARLPRTQWRRPRVRVAVGPYRSQLRSIPGLPATRDPRVVSGVVHENVHRFFLRHDVPLVTGEAVAGAGDSWWSSAFEAPTVEAIARGCAGARVRLEAVLPTVGVLGAASEGTQFTWEDGGIAVNVRFDNGLVEVRRVESSGEVSNPLCPSGLASYRDLGPDFADACAAAVITHRGVPGLMVNAARSRAPTSPRRLALAGAALLLSGLLALASPGLGASLTIARVEEQLAERSRAANVAAAEHAELRRLQSALTEFEALADTRTTPRTRLLALLAESLPDSTALRSLRVDSMTVELVVLAPRIERVATRLDRTAWFGSPQIVGLITREVLGSTEWERATIRFSP